MTISPWLTIGLSIAERNANWGERWLVGGVTKKPEHNQTELTAELPKRQVLQTHFRDTINLTGTYIQGHQRLTGEDPSILVMDGDLGFEFAITALKPNPSAPRLPAYPMLPLLAWPMSKGLRRGLPMGSGIGTGCINELLGRLRDDVLEELEAVLLARRWRLMLSGSTSGMLAKRAKTERTRDPNPAININAQFRTSGTDHRPSRPHHVGTLRETLQVRATSTRRQ